MKNMREIRRAIVADIRKRKKEIEKDLERVISEIKNPTGAFDPKEAENTLVPNYRKMIGVASNLENCRTEVAKIKYIVSAWKSIARA